MIDVPTPVLPVRVRVARRFRERARGLLFSCRLPEGMALLLPRTCVVHGMLMRRPLDLAFVSADHRVLDVATLPPGRIRWCRGAAAVLEFEAGQLALLGIRPGSRLRFVSQDDDPSVDGPSRILAAFVAGLVSMGLAGLGAGLSSAAQAASAGHAGGGHVERANVEGVDVAALGIATSNNAEPGNAKPGNVTPANRPILPAAWRDRFAQRAESLYRSGADEEALAAFATWLDADPDAEALVILRVGNLHQRNGRDWLAIDSYRRALDLPPPADPAAADARRKALVNLEGLLESASHQVAAAVAEIHRTDGAPGAMPAPMSAGGVASMPSAVPPATSPSIPHRPLRPRPAVTSTTMSTAGSAGRAHRSGATPAVEYLGSR